ncbi:hybrid sensor histidine kinase/response regulator [Comamonas jiangduensis]|uniref:hybrid sensor histidine kinase/response regulator n=1 Tax=Comamonas jiangduensis TaxID=1194168 RepID=UPI003BF793FC
MTETAPPSADAAPLTPRQLLLPSLTAMVHDLAQMLPPSSVVQALQARQLLQQMSHAVQVVELSSLGQLMQAMEVPLQAYASTGESPAEKAGELLQLAARDMQAFLQALNSGAQPPSQELFASYRAITKLGGKDSAHPADLWDAPWPTPALAAPTDTSAIAPSAEIRAQFDQHVLALLQTSNPSFCTTLQQLSLGLAAHAQDGSTWQLAAAWLQALEYGLLEVDIYAKRLASRLLAHYASFAKGDEAPPAALVRDLLFFCAQAVKMAQQRQQPLPDTLAIVHQHCQPGADTNSSALTGAVNTPTTGATATAIDSAACATAADPAHTDPAPPPAVRLPAFQAAPEIHPAETLVNGLATSAQMEPDLDFLQTAETLSQQLESAIAVWQSDEQATLAAATAENTGELSRLAWAAGCTEIATLAHLLQRCLLRMPEQAVPPQRQTCQHASEEIRRLLHQFAAGFMRRAHPQVMDALHSLYAQLPEPVEVPATPVVPPPAPASAVIDSSSDDGFVLDTDVDMDDEANIVTAAEPAPASPAPVLDAMHFSVFEEEMLSIWPKLQSALKQWIKAPQDSSARQILLRSLHTLKGSARLAGAMPWASQVHALEGLAIEVPNEEGPRGPASLPQPLEALRIAFVALQQEMADRHPERQSGRLNLNPLEAVARHAQALWHSQDMGQQALAASTMSLHEIASSLQKLRTQIQDCAAWADTLMLHGDVELPYEWHEELHDLVHALNDCTDDLGTAQQQLQHGVEDTQQALTSHAGHLRALQHTLLYARLLPLTHIQERLSACVQLAAQDAGKSVDVFWQGAEAVMERNVQEALTPALEHLLRNSVAHGIETAPQRKAAQKAATGKILIRLHTAGHQQVLSIFDDGAGLNTEAIRRKAVALGLIAAEEPVDHTRAAALILHPGLSTAGSVTELAGRGIGMDAVVDTIHQLHGKLHVSSNPGKGCRIDITLPAPPQVEQVLALRAGSWRVAIPARSLETVRRIPAAVADQALAQGVLQDKAAAPLPIYWAGAVWQQSSRSLEPPLDGQRSLLIVRGDTARWGVIVDEVLGTQEVTLQAPADLEVPIPGLLGTAAQPSGQVLQVYEPTAVLSAHETRLLNQHEAQAPVAEPHHEPERPLVLLADDSMSVRRLAQHLLQASGYRVATAADGLEALQLLEEGHLPALLIVDVEMPDMDGMELLRRVRADARFQHLPVVMLTAHAAGPVSHKAISMGAQAFLTKPYSPNELLAQVRRYATLTSVA